ncbi:MAG TPA: hypothetical protein VG826_02060 [Pirellulales bacterium]|nr:hypothetical protein [Pirellulales bacterium]
MVDEPKQRKRDGAAAWTLSALLVLYVLSTGPAVTALGASGSHPAVVFAFRIIYAPLALFLALLPQRCEAAIDRWIALWGFYGAF